MSHCEFFLNLASIAISHGLRLMINRAPIGCGFHFFFIDDRNQDRSPSIFSNVDKENPEELFERLNTLADEFKRRNHANLY